MGVNDFVGIACSVSFRLVLLHEFSCVENAVQVGAFPSWLPSGVHSPMSRGSGKALLA